MDVNFGDDPESADSSGPDDRRLDLTPRAGGPPPRSRSALRRFSPWAVAALVVVGVGVMASNLAGATTYFYNVDEAVAKRSELGTRRIRIQGNVVEGSVNQRGSDLTFSLKYHSVAVPVTLTDEPPDLFGPAIPVVVEGRFSGARFLSDRALVKHDEKYTEKNSKRLREADDDAKKSA